MDHVGFHLCDRCDGIILLREEVVGIFPKSGTPMFLHNKCALPENKAILVVEWLDLQTAKPLLGSKED